MLTDSALHFGNQASTVDKNTMYQSEEELLFIAAQDGDRNAFNKLYNRYQKRLVHYAFKVSGRMHLAEDAAQEAWVSFAKNIRKIKDPRAFKSWLYKMVRWRVTDLLRDSGKYQSLEEYEDIADEKSSFESEQSELYAAMSKLPSIEKQIIHLFYLDELKVAEIAQILDIPSGTVKSRLSRARRMLKEKFNQ